MRDWLVVKALTFLLPIALGPITYLLGRKLLNAWRWIDDTPPLVKRVLIFALAVAIAGCFKALGQPLPDTCFAVITGAVSDECAAAIASSPVLTGLVGALVALFIHNVKKEDPRDRP